MRLAQRLAVVLSLLGALLATGCGGDAPPEVVPSRHERLRLQLRERLSVGGAEDEAREIAQEILDTCDPDDAEARRLLGWTDFQADVLGRFFEPGEDPIPEAIANRSGYEFLEEIEELTRERWLRDPVEVERARQAVAAMHEHARRLEADHRYRRGDGIRANLASDRLLAPYNIATAWTPPYLVCAVCGKAPTDYELLQIADPRVRSLKRAGLREERARFRPKVEASARILTQLNDEFLRRFGEHFDLKPLDAPYGGRPDYPPGVRSYPDGVPLTVLLFDDEEAFQEFHLETLGIRRRALCRGYFQPTNGWIFAFAHPDYGADQDREVRTLLRLGTYQLLWWYTRQRSKWGASKVGTDWLGAGMAGLLSGVRVGPDLELEFTGVNLELLRKARKLAEVAQREGRPYPLRPLKELATISSYRELARREEPEGRPVFGAPAEVVTDADLWQYFQQSYLFVLFLQEYADGRYREAFYRYLRAYLSRETQFGMAEKVLRRHLRIDATEWPRLDEEFRAFVVDDVLKREPR